MLFLSLDLDPSVDDVRAKFGGRGEHYIYELQKNLPALQQILLEMLAKERKQH